jgi:hypothetical protein
MTPAELRRKISDSLMTQLRTGGFVAKGNVLIRRRLPAVTDWLAISAFGRQSSEPIQATVNVGIHCPPLHRLLATLDSTKYSETVATFATNIGYLRIPSGYREWAFDRQHADEAQLSDLAAEVPALLLPFLEQFIDLDSVRRGCEEYGLHEYNRLRLSVLDYLAGNAAQAKELLRYEVESMSGRSDPAALHFRLCADVLFQKIGASDAAR